MKKLALLFALGALTFSACQSDTETVAPAATKTQQLTAGPWHITAWTKTTGSGTPADQLAPLSACQKDDRYTFGTNGVLTRTEGPTACGSGNSQTVVSTSPWNFNSTQTVLTIGSAAMGATSIPYDVVLLTADNLQLRYTRTSGGSTVVDNIVYAN
jgi:hypothetical protein